MINILATICDKNGKSNGFSLSCFNSSGRTVWYNAGIAFGNHWILSSSFNRTAKYWSVR